jgi:hypothetical protein
MKKRVLILVMLLVVSFLTQASNDKEVIKSIKGNYYSIKENWDDLYKYKSTSNGSDILVYSEIESFTTENHYCVVIKEQKIIYEYYIKGEKLYFVFTNNNGLENRYYFNSNDEIIRWLDADKLEIVNGLDVKSEELFSKLFLVKSKSDIIDKFINSVNSRYYNPTTINRDSAISENEGVFKLIYENKNIGFLMLFALLILVLFIKKRSSKENVIEDGLNASNTTKNRRVNEAEKINKVYSDGSKYVGEWKDGKRHGIGVFTKSTKHNNLAPGELFVISIYDGEWKDDCRFGEGLFTEEYMAGDNHHSYLERYTGKWNLDKYHGKGKLTDSKGNIYDGDWELGVKDGWGVMTYTNGNTYEGEWKDDKRHGHGTYIYDTGSKYVGEYKDDIMHGHGAYTYANGNTYEGEMKDGEMHGHGKYSVDGYGVFVGDFVKGGIAGKGVFNYTNGEKYDGEWKDAKRHGKGVYTFSDGFEYDGFWDVGFFIDGEKRIDITDSEYKKSKKIADLKFKGKGKYQIKLMGKGVNYIEMWMDKDRLDEIGEENIDAEYFEDNLINGERIIDISGVIVESGFKIKIDALDSASKEPEIIEGNVHMEFINDTVDELCYESDEFADVFEDQVEADYNDFDENKVLIQYIQVERGAYFEFQMEDFELSKFQLYPWCLERFNDFDIIIGGVYDGKKIDFEFGDCTGIRAELRIIHHPDNIGYEWDY